MLDNIIAQVKWIAFLCGFGKTVYTVPELWAANLVFENRDALMKLHAEGRL